MNNKITFPKDSLKVKRIPVVKDLGLGIKKSAVDVKAYANKTNFFHKLPKWIKADKKAERVPKEFADAMVKYDDDIRNTRKSLKNLDHNFKYELTFTHPKWAKFKRAIAESKEEAFGSITKTCEKREDFKKTLEEIRKDFKAKKDEWRKLRLRNKSTHINSLQYDIKYDVSGGIIHMPSLKNGVFIQFLKDQEKRIVFSNKTPKEKKNHIGVELEFFCEWDKEKLGYALYDAGVGKNITLKTDASIKCGCGVEPQQCGKCKGKLFSHELCVIVKENEYHEVLKLITDVLTASNAQVNKTCGMHVHLDMRNRDVEKAYQNLVSGQSILYKMNPKSRIEKYAKKTQERNFEVATNLERLEGREARYHGINPIAYKTHQTIEIRIHAGTIDYSKIVNWIDILVNVANHEERLVKTFKSIDTFCEVFDIGNKLKKYIKERADKFNIDVEGINVEAERGVA